MTVVCTTEGRLLSTSFSNLTKLTNYGAFTVRPWFDSEFSLKNSILVDKQALLFFRLMDRLDQGWAWQRQKKATARANQFACLFRVAGNRKQQISSLAATLFFAGNEIGFYRQRKSLPATKLVSIGNKQVCRKPKAIRRQQKKRLCRQQKRKISGTTLIILVF